jgi:RimJ/RimL family protein N-acetyltransferase
MDDLRFTHKWHSDRDLYDTLVGPFRYVSLEAEEEWLRGKVAFSNQEVNLMICLHENAKPIGLVSVRDIDWFARKGHLAGIFIGEAEYQNQGHGTEALNLMIKHCFQDLGLNRIYTNILADNLASQAMFKKCGFSVEGQLRQHAFKEGKLRDVVLVGICSDQYCKKN